MFEDTIKISDDLLNRIYDWCNTRSINSLYYDWWGDELFLDKTLSLEEEKKLFLIILKCLLDKNFAVLYPPNEVVLKNDFTSTKVDSEGVALWDISIDEMIDYIKKHMPLIPDVRYWFGDYCPRIGWVNIRTGEIKMGW